MMDGIYLHYLVSVVPVKVEWVVLLDDEVGVWFLIVPKGYTVSVLELSGAGSGQASIIKLEK